MNRLLVIASVDDNASILLYKKISCLFEKMHEDRKCDKNNPTGANGIISYSELEGMFFGRVGFVLINEPLLYCNPDSYAQDYDSICFLSRHAARSGNSCITMHAIGNFGKALYGGRDGMLVMPESLLMSTIYNNASKKSIMTGIASYDVSMEAVHHGPYSEKRCFFYEIGSSEKNWNDDKAAGIMAHIFMESLYCNNHGRESFFGIGSNHYCSGFYDLLGRYDFAGSCSEHSAERLNERHLSFISSYASRIFIHPNLKRYERKRITGMLDSLSIKYEML